MAFGRGDRLVISEGLIRFDVGRIGFSVVVVGLRAQWGRRRSICLSLLMMAAGGES
jgi:hypothetical protein